MRRRGDFTRPKKGCSKLLAMNAVKMLQFLLSLEKASLFTVAHVSRNASQKGVIVPNRTSVLTRRTRGQDETVVSKEEKNKSQLVFLKSTKL